MKSIETGRVQRVAATATGGESSGSWSCARSLSAGILSACTKVDRCRRRTSTISCPGSEAVPTRATTFGHCASVVTRKRRYSKMDDGEGGENLEGVALLDRWRQYNTPAVKFWFFPTRGDGGLK